ncbi:hypothetical protein CK203_056404 [Vitis vinifera]|uniref:Protein FAR1-RELATED SEQUENCE n=1 Tax=Vitis vinifera TaxID=29760 RepID=A0A438GPD5_VITVI|nr:hypothetical protein CK203_056404 [Vitis vinifera]
MIVVMKIEHLEEIPESCIMKRWSKLAKEMVQVHHDNESQGDATNIIQYGALSSMCSWMSYFASQSEKTFKEARCEIQRLTYQMEELCKNSMEEGEREDLKATKHHVKDLNTMKTKDNPAKIHNASIHIEDSIGEMGDMSSLLNHNMEGRSRHETNEFTQNGDMPSLLNHNMEGR